MRSNVCGVDWVTDGLKRKRPRNSAALLFFFFICDEMPSLLTERGNYEIHANHFNINAK